jgi:RHS repeat-associated protein
VVLQQTGLMLPTGAPLELTFDMGNTDTAPKRLHIAIHNASYDDMAVCSFWLDPGQTPRPYVVRVHTTTPWANATVAFYAADQNAPSSQGAYQLNHVTLTYRPSLSSAKTECVDPLAPTSGGWPSGNILSNPNFEDGLTGWTISNPGSLPVQVVNTTLEFYWSAGAAPTITQVSSWGMGQGHRVAAFFDLGNTSPTRQFVSVQVQGGDDSAMTICAFWLPPLTPKRQYAMKTYVSRAWPTTKLVIVPNSAGPAGTHAWLQFDSVEVFSTVATTLGTECFEPGSFVVQPGGPGNPGQPVPMPATDALATEHAALFAPSARFAERTDESQRSFNSGAEAITFHSESEGESAPFAEAEPARTDPVTVTISGTGSGALTTVTSNPGGITCAGSTVSCTGWFQEGTSVTLTATVGANGPTFLGWTGACSGTGSCVLFIQGSQTVGAVFGTGLEFYHLDAIGSVRMVTNAAGAVVKRNDYFAFGEDIAPMTGDPRRFTGKELDPETAQHYFGARYYRNLWGRFTSVDPGQASGSPADPQGWNAYAYVRNNPLRFIDPEGLTYVVYSPQSGISTVDDADWQPMIANPG